MLDRDKNIALFAEASMGSTYAKMSEGMIKYGQNPISAVIDSDAAGRTLREVCGIESNIPIVSTIEEACQLGAEVLILGTAPSGGRFPTQWDAHIKLALNFGMSIVNGLHDNLTEQYSKHLKSNQWIWDVRRPLNPSPRIGAARSSFLKNIRILMIGTDMAVGKMTSGLEICKFLKDANYDAEFLATGQTGICITGSGIPLDAYKIDYASGAVEDMVLKSSERQILVVEGQGSLLNPGSTATLPLMRGSCPSHMVLCHRAGQEFVESDAKVRIPNIKDVINLNETLANAVGSLVIAKVISVSLNTKHLDEQSAIVAIDTMEQELGIPVQDPVRFSAKKLVHSIV